MGPSKFWNCWKNQAIDYPADQGYQGKDPFGKVPRGTFQRFLRVVSRET